MKVPSADSELLAIVETILGEQGYAVERLENPFSMILAENVFFVIAVVSCHTIQDLTYAQGAAEQALVERLATVNLGPKKWDAYLVLLTQERSREDDLVTRELYAINYDTTRLRRIAHTAVSATSVSVSHAMAPFLAPPEGSAMNMPGDPFARLLDALEARGVDRNIADRAISAFEQGGSLSDVL